MAQQNLRARQKQRQRFIMILVVLLLLGAGVFYFFSSKQEKKPANVSRPDGMVAVPVISREIPLGGRISTNLFTVTFMKPEAVPADAILSVPEFLGRYVTRPLQEGNYIRVSDVASAGASGGYSALAKDGMRLVVLDSKMFPGSISSLRIGDRVDLLAIGSPTGLVRGATNTGKSLADSGVTLQGGGSQPGDTNSNARKNARARAAAANNASAPFAASATLVAENAEVMRTPSKGVDTEYLVLQMNPQDAHVTTLMAATGTVMRVVFRPFNDETRLTQDMQAKITTRLPKPVEDPDAVLIIAGNVQSRTKPNSTLTELEKTTQGNQFEPAKNLTYSDVNGQFQNYAKDNNQFSGRGGDTNTQE